MFKSPEACCTPVPVQRDGLWKELDDAFSSLDILEEVIKSLHSTLAPITKPVVVTPNNNQSGDELEPTSIMAGKLRELRVRIRASTRSLEELRMYLDI